jgi:hypothetical protein
MQAVLIDGIPGHRSSRPGKPQRAFPVTAVAAVLAGGYGCHG